MSILYAQHAMAGQYHLQTRFIDGQWEWKAIAIKDKRLPEYTGTSATLDGAKQSAASSIGLARANWLSIGPPLEFPD